MKIDEGCINHNAVRLISEITSCLYDSLGDDMEKQRILMDGEIHGITMLAEELKKVLDA